MTNDLFHPIDLSILYQRRHVSNISGHVVDTRFKMQDAGFKMQDSRCTCLRQMERVEMLHPTCQLILEGI